jgi:hypothetical protein
MEIIVVQDTAQENGGLTVQVAKLTTLRLLNVNLMHLLLMQSTTVANNMICAVSMQNWTLHQIPTVTVIKDLSHALTKQNVQVMIFIV